MYGTVHIYDYLKPKLFKPLSEVTRDQAGRALILLLNKHIYKQVRPFIVCRVYSVYAIHGVFSPDHYCMINTAARCGRG